MFVADLDVCDFGKCGYDTCHCGANVITCSFSNYGSRSVLSGGTKHVSEIGQVSDLALGSGGGGPPP